MRMNFDAVQQEGGFAEDREIDWTQVDLPCWCNARINWQQEKQTANKKGRFLAVAFKLTSGELDGGTAWGQFTVSNPNAQAVEIGHRQLGELMWACGLKKGADSKQLVGKRCQVYLKGEESERFGLQGKPVAFKPIDRDGQQQGERQRQGHAAMGEVPYDPGVDDGGYPAPGGQGPSPAGYDERSPPPMDIDDLDSIPF